MGTVLNDRNANIISDMDTNQDGKITAEGTENAESINGIFNVA